MDGTYKATGLDPGDVPLRLGRCIEIAKSRSVVRTPPMYGQLRAHPMGWLRPIEDLRGLRFCDKLFSSDVAVTHAVHSTPQPSDSSESAILVATLLVAFPNARFGIGLRGDGEFLSMDGDYRSLGKHPIQLHHGSTERALVTQVFDYLRHNAYWVNDDFVHMLALLTDICQDRDRIVHRAVLSLSTSGNHLVDPGLFHAYQLVEALLELGDREPLNDAVARWNAVNRFQLDCDEINFIRDVRDVCLHFKAQRAGQRLNRTRVALGFEQDHSREREFRSHGVQRLLREIAQAYVLARI